MGELKPYYVLKFSEGFTPASEAFRPTLAELFALDASLRDTYDRLISRRLITLEQYQRDMAEPKPDVIVQGS